jgi:hypothetical protein
MTHTFPELIIGGVLVAPCELVSQHGAKCRAACAINRSLSAVALPKRRRIVEYHGFWRSLGESNPCFRRERATS